jgi:hypothetical protein
MCIFKGAGFNDYMNQLRFYIYIVLAIFSNACDDAKQNVTVVSPTPAPVVILVSPPFAGTIFLDPNIITKDDPTSFKSLIATGQGSRLMFDRRVNNWTTVNAFLFLVTFDDGLSTEVQVNPEFITSELAQVEAQKYAVEIGRLPKSLRKNVETVWIHKGVQPFGGGNKNILIHIGQADLYVRDGILEETLVHEASHTSLDATHAASSGWVDAQRKDPTFISTYARDNPTREDLAETFLLYLAVTHRKDRISSALEKTVTATIPNRINYLNSQSWDLHPFK